MQIMQLNRTVVPSSDQVYRPYVIDSAVCQHSIAHTIYHCVCMLAYVCDVFFKKKPLLG